MTSIEVTGKSVEDAVKAAAAELQIPEDQVEYQVLEEGSKGFLGIGGRLTRIKASPKRRVAAEERAPREERKPRREAAPRPPKEPRVAKPRAKPTPAAPAEELPDAHAEDDRKTALALLQNVLDAMDLKATPRIVNESDEEIVIDITGSDLAILIGKHGQTLDALQFLISIAVHRGAKARKRIILDVEGYRERRDEMLRHKAHEYARRVKETSQEAELEPQTARDRRIIHTALSNDPDVYTYSEGEGDERHVVISPKT